MIVVIFLISGVPDILRGYKHIDSPFVLMSRNFCREIIFNYFASHTTMNMIDLASRSKDYVLDQLAQPL